MGEGKAICISASNRMGGREMRISRRICEMVADVLAEEEIVCKILELKKYEPAPCTGCGRCSDISRCGRDKDFNRIYEEFLEAEYLFFVSPCYAPVPAKLCMILEKMQQTACLHLQRDRAYQPELRGKLAGIISYGDEDCPGGRNPKAMVNDTIASVLSGLRLKVVPYNSKWDTGIFLPAEKTRNAIQRTDRRNNGSEGWEMWEEIRKYVEVTVQTAKSLYAIL